LRKPFKKSLKDVPIENAHGGSGRRQLILSEKDAISENLRGMTKGFLSSGEVFDWHVHENVDEFFLVLKGKGSVEFEKGQEISYEPGDIVYLPSNLKHKIINTGKEENEFFFVRLDQ